MVAELTMDRRLVWDAARLKEIDEAKAEIMMYKRQGYIITHGDGVTPMERFSPALQEVVIKAVKTTKHTLKILDVTGDTRLTWDKENGKEAKEAKVKFEELLGKGWKAYSVNSKGNKNRKIEEFDVDSQEILMIPPTAKG